MTDLAKLVVKLEAQTAQYHAEMKKANDRLAAYQRQTNIRLASINKQWASFGAGIQKAIGAIGFGVVLRKIVTETSAAQKALSQLEAVVKSTGGAAGFTVPELVGMSEELQRTTTFADDQVQSMQALLLQFTRLTGPEFKQAQQAVVDMATRLDKDLGSAALAVGKALNDPIRGMAALAKQGVQFSKDQEVAIRQMVRTGNLAEAQGVVLAELEKRFGGAAAAARNTFGGALAGVTNALNDLFEVSSEGSSKATESLNNLAAVLQDPAFKQAADTLLSGLINSLAWILENSGKVVAGIAVIFGAAGDRVEEINAEIEDLQNLAASGGGIVFGSAFGEEGLASIITPEEIDKQIKALIREQEALLGVGVGGMEAAKGLKAASDAMDDLSGAGSGNAGDPESIASIEKLIAGLKQQVDTFGMSAAAIARYRIEQGDLAEEFEGAGDRADALGNRLITLSGRFEQLQASAKRAQEVEQAGAAIEKMVEDLREQVAVFGLGEVAVMRYRLEHGKLAATFAVAGAALEPLKQQLLDLTAALEQQQLAAKNSADAQRAADEQVAEAKSIFDETRTAAERYAATIARLDELLAANAITQDTYNRAAAAAVKTLEEAGKEANKFAEQATRNVQDIVSTFLEDLALEGKFSFDSLLADFNKMLIRMAAQAVAAQLAQKLFGGEGVGSGEGWMNTALKAAGNWVVGAFGGAKAMGGPVEGGKRYRVHPGEWFAPSDGTIEKDDSGGGAGMVVHMNFTVQSENGRVSRQTEQQIAASAQRGLQRAAARNN